jgi:hypothetical protein
VSTPVWCADLAAQFWAAAGPPPRFPRDLLAPVAVGFPVTVIHRHRLSVARVVEWFTDRSIRLRLDELDRPLRACLVADRGQGFIFLEAADDPAERRFSLAHEVAHFLRDYWHLRETTNQRLGPNIQAVLDGHRAPTLEERVQAVLRNVPVGPFTHLLRRDESGRPLTPTESEAEAAADRLAFELLAPVSALGSIVNRASLLGRLVKEFGLPPAPAGRYAAILVPELIGSGPVIGRIIRS